MELFNLLSDASISLYGQTFEVYLNWIGTLIKGLVGLVGVGVGVILFSLILKVIVMPFDIYQRVTMRKQNQKMKENQARMEKLQKQYANDKDAYNQKVMEMYKENGISMFSSCLPMILSMVIFIVAINAFTAYSRFASVENYNLMVQAYNGKLESYCADLKMENVSDDGSTLVYVKDTAGEGKYIYYTVPYTADYANDNYAYIQNANKTYYVDVAKVYANKSSLSGLSEKITEYVADKTGDEAAAKKNEAISDYFVGLAQDAVVETYETEVVAKTKFLWIKNVWATDASYKHPVLDYKDFEAEVSTQKFKVQKADGKIEKVKLSNLKNDGFYAEGKNPYDGEVYNRITAKLGEQKKQANGWYILIALSIGTILLQQFVSNRSQKEQQKYSSVDGQGASQQKMTMVIMTGMFAIFAFSYSAAFSIYMIMSNIISLISTLVINKAVDVVADKREQKALQEKYNKRFPGRKNGNDKKAK